MYAHDSSFWRAGAVATSLFMSVLLAALTIDTLGQIRPGSPRVPSYDVINDAVTYASTGARRPMIPDVLSTLIALCLVCIAVLDGGLLVMHRWMLAVIGAVLVGLGVWAMRVDYLKWPGAAVTFVGIAIVLLVVSGVAAASSETVFWVVFWSGNAAGVPSLWSALYRGPAASASER
jgi:hypothetical protein